VASNDPMTPLVTVPATLTVTGAPHIQIPDDLITQESQQTYSTTAATTAHLFPIALPPVGGGTLQLFAVGNFETGSATLTGGGGPLGSVGDTGNSCGTASGIFQVSPGRLAGLAAGGEVAIDVDNSEDVGAGCATNSHTVQLRYSPERETLDFGQVPAGESRELPLNIVNSGSAHLHVSSVTSSAAEFSTPSGSLQVDPNEAGSVMITFTPPALGEYSATLSIASDDPDRPLLELQLTGEGITP
jgi:hypothetical protein